MNQTHFPGNESEKNITPSSGKSKIRWKIFSLAILVLLLASVNVQADTIQTFEIQDLYVGADVKPSGSSWDTADQIGLGAFEIDKMIVNIGSSQLNVKIYTNFVNNIGLYETGLGDLFISTTGWNPYDPDNDDAPYYYDDNMNSASTTNWNYALVLDGHFRHELLDNSGNLIKSGSSSLYYIGGDIINESYEPPLAGTYYYRDGQAYRFQTTKTALDTSGRWEIFQGNNSTKDSIDSYLEFQIGLSGFGLKENEYYDLAFHWTMSCGNDVIEGEIKDYHHTPEPATMLLFGVGLIGLAGVIRKKTYN